jgi:hypothetical protein
MNGYTTTITPPEFGISDKSYFCDMCCGFGNGEDKGFAIPFCTSAFGCPPTGNCAPKPTLNITCTDQPELCAEYETCTSGVCVGKNCSSDANVCNPDGVCNDGKCISSGCGGKVGEEIPDFVYGSWSMKQTKLTLTLNAVAYVSPAPVAIYNVTKVPFNSNTLVIIFFRIYSDTNLIASLDTKWLGPFVGKIVDKKLCILTEPKYNSVNDGYTVIPTFPIVNDKENGFNDKGELYVTINTKKGYVNSGVRYSDIYEGKMWSCTIDSSKKTLSFTLTFTLEGKTYSFANEASRANISSEMNRTAPVNLYKNSGCSDTICPKTLDQLWKLILLAIGVIVLILIGLVIMYAVKYKNLKK